MPDIYKCIRCSQIIDPDKSHDCPNAPWDEEEEILPDDTLACVMVRCGAVMFTTAIICFTILMIVGMLK